jgi:hexosaminidase
MKRFVIAVILCNVLSNVISQDTQSTISIIPQPVSLTAGTGSFSLTNSSQIEIATSDADVKRIADSLSKKIATATGYNIPVKTVSSSSNTNGSIRLALAKDASIGNEGYKLNTTPESVSITANAPAGLFYGVQTFYQLLPKEIEGKTVAKDVNWIAPACNIVDFPRFGWRGLMFDVSRHFFTKNELKQFIDNMVKYKYNLLHLTLSNDEGWRIEIKSLPNLTKVGAWRVNKVGYFGTFTPPKPGEPADYGGFYTQDDIKELVQYAKEKFVNILPEIDVPGHSLAAVVSYPELSCTPGADKYHVRAGEEIMDWSHGHPPIALLDNTLCPANEKVYTFLDKVITEVAALFPFEYLHMGGDECPKNFWAKNEAVKALAKREGLKNMEEVQSYFEKRVEKIVTSKGKKFIGWDEILEGGLGPSAAVMSWRGVKGGIAAAKMKHDVVMCPTDFTYIDYMQADAVIEPKVYATLRLSKAYQFEPLPDGVDPKYIKGGQANLWTEQVYNMRHAEYMVWPRGFAIAESVWSPAEKRNWNDFFNRVEKHFERFDVAETKYAPSVYDPIFKVSRSADKKLKVELSTEVEGLDIYYTFDNSFPDRFYPKYTKPLVPPTDAVMLKVVTYKGNKQIGRVNFMPVEELENRAGKK